MCERCWLDMMMYGEAAEHEAPAWEKGRFQAEPAPVEAAKTKTANAAPDPDDRDSGRGQEE